jgi:hypothetical protein
MKNEESSQNKNENQGVVHNGPSPNPSVHEGNTYPSQTYALLDYVNGHVVFEKDGQHVFVDTGANVSFGRQENWEFMGETYHLPAGFPIISPDYLTKQIGVQIDFLVGMNLLKDYYLKIIFRDRQITFSKNPLPMPGRCKRLEFKLAHGCLPYSSIKMNGTPRLVHIDTGAKINFLCEKALEGLEPKDKEMDFSPYEEREFETDIYEVPVEIVNEILVMRTGILPPKLEELIDNINGLEGALGIGLYEKYIATFDFRNRVLWLEESKEDIMDT